MRFFSAATGITAPAVDEETRSAIASTCSWSNHLRAVLDATSAFSW